VLGTASGEDLGAIGKITVRGFLEGQKAEFEAIAATKVRKCLLSGIRLREGGYSLVLHGDGSYIEKNGKRAYLTRDGKRDVTDFKIYKKVDQTNMVTMKGVQRELLKLKKEIKTMKMGPVPDMEDEARPFTEEEQR
jgi:hypothetical protein